MAETSSLSTKACAKSTGGRKGRNLRAVDALGADLARAGAAWTQAHVGDAVQQSFARPTPFSLLLRQRT
jgi:hypothetical protein